MLKLKKIKSGEYITSDGKYIIEKDDGYWYGIDSKTYKSVVDSETTLSQIKDALELKINKNIFDRT